VGRRWVTIGHSQGGHAVLWAAALARQYAPGLRLAGALPLAPATHIGEQAALIDSIQGNPFGGLPALISAAAADAAGLAPATVFSERAQALYPQIDTVCLDVLTRPDSFGGLSLNELFNPSLDRAPLLAVLAANDPEDLKITVPLQIAQGEADRTVLPPFTDQTVTAYRARGTRINYDTYPGVNHTDIPRASRADNDAFIRKLLR
jgi:pimeloyl-ACP methyl ester carboxylesterase